MFLLSLRIHGCVLGVSRNKTDCSGLLIHIHLKMSLKILTFFLIFRNLLLMKEKQCKQKISFKHVQEDVFWSWAMVLHRWAQKRGRLILVNPEKYFPGTNRNMVAYPLANVWNAKPSEPQNCSLQDANWRSGICAPNGRVLHMLHSHVPCVASRHLTSHNRPVSHVRSIKCIADVNSDREAIHVSLADFTDWFYFLSQNT